MNNYNSIVGLIEALKEDKCCLKEITYKTTKGQVRHISSTAISNVIKYLFNNDGENTVVNHKMLQL